MHPSTLAENQTIPNCSVRPDAEGGLKRVLRWQENLCSLRRNLMGHYTQGDRHSRCTVVTPRWVAFYTSRRLNWREGGHIKSPPPAVLMSFKLLSPIYNSYRILRYTILPKPSGREVVCSKMKQRTIYHSIVEPGRILFHRHGLPRITLSDILDRAPRSCRDCATGNIQYRVPCITADKGFKVHVALCNAWTSQCHTIPQGKDSISLCELYTLAWQLIASTLADASKETPPSSDQDAFTGVSITELVWDEAKLHWLVKWEPEDS
ncbi:hypothetical protein BC629DRAFT_1056840 [Irpex lacteus]|nr:hypothetical protein BC629DRAFT_1056840 [Irpex lacteus]